MQDGELYELIGHGWRLPIFVRWLDPGMAEVKLCNIPLLRRMRTDAEAALAAWSQHRDGNKWFFSRKHLEACAIPSRFLDPEDVVIWRRPVNEIHVQTDFVNAYCKTRDAGVRNPILFGYIWSSACNFMLEWLLFHQKPIDLGFATLNAFCARANWQTAVIGRLMARKANHKQENSAEARRRETRKILNQSFVTAWDNENGVVRWTLDITPEEPFHSAALQFETKRKRVRSRYLAQILRLLKSPQHKDRMYASHLAFDRQTKSPYAALPHGALPGHKGEGEEPGVGPQPPPHWPQTPVVAGAKMEDGSGRAVVSEDACLPKVPALEQLSEDLRHTRKNLDATREEIARAIGVHMLATTEERNPGPDLHQGVAEANASSGVADAGRGELLAISGDGRGNGLAPLVEQLPNPDEKVDP